MLNRLKLLRSAFSTVLALLCLFSLGISTHSQFLEVPEEEKFFEVEFAEDEVIKFGYGYAWCGNLGIVDLGPDNPPYAESGHYVSFYHYLEKKDVQCNYTFRTEVMEQPNYRQDSWDKGIARRYDIDTNTVHPYSHGSKEHTYNFFSLDGLPKRERPYTLEAYTRLDAGGKSDRAVARILFTHN